MSLHALLSFSAEKIIVVGKRNYQLSKRVYNRIVFSKLIIFTLEIRTFKFDRFSIQYIS
jgi:hypothetical protein